MVACSGGRDSLSLAYALHVLRPDYVRVVHINHQLQQPSDDWAKWLLVQCQQWQLPCDVRQVVVESGNVEAQARKARYAALFDALQPDEILVLGHHQQDQAETVFLRLLSGSGVKGLSAMRILDHQKAKWLWRPLLDCSRQQITELAGLICPEYIDDPANAQPNFDRVFLRQQIWPLLKARWPALDQTFNRSALLMQDSHEILQEVLAQDWLHCGDQNTLDINALELLGQPRQRLLLSSWMQVNEQYAPAFHLVEQVRQTILDARQDANPKIVWQNWQFRRYQNKLYRLPKNLVVATDLQLDWPLQTTIELPSGTWQWQQQEFGLSPELMQHTWQLKARRGGEVLHLQGRIGQWPLKKTLQDANLPPWQREQIHILNIQDQLVGVFTAQGFWLNQNWVSQVQRLEDKSQSQACWVENGWLPCLVPQSKS